MSEVEVAVLGSPSLIVLYGLCGRKATLNKRTCVRVQELCESRGGCSSTSDTAQELCQKSRFRSCVRSRGGRPGLPVPDSPVRFLWT